MALNPQAKDRLARFTLVAKAIIYDANRMQQFLGLMGTKDGAITAVKTVMGAIDTKTQIPPDLAPLLGVNVYMLLVDVAQEVTGKKPNPAIMRDVIFKIVSGIQPAAGAQAAPQAATPPQGGMINQPAGVV